MTQAAAERRAERVEIFPHILEYLATRSAMRYLSRPSQLSAAAKKIAMNVSAQRRRNSIASA